VLEVVPYILNQCLVDKLNILWLHR